ncbi:MAG: WG repeat-containing protein [Fibromonadaceae bacterium]|jgi:hypothetical protein|nr:WG repeat-containing protein [Fibromonadaceae bacterium]
MNKIAIIATITLLALLLLIGCANRSNATKNADLPVSEQDNDIWTAFYGDSNLINLIGYKDKKGNIKIELKFLRTSSDEFDKIIAVEEYDGERKNYFLTKEGRVFGIDSVYFFDNVIHHQCEGFFNFIDRKTYFIGMFDRNGNVVIPADYNYLDIVKNGMLLALKGAKKECLDEYCEHNEFVGGKVMLIDTLNNVLIENFSERDDSGKYLGDLDFFSVEKSKVPHSDTTRVSYLAKDGSYYSFTIFEREFKQWLLNDLLANLTLEKLIDASNDTIKQFITDNFELLKKELSLILNSDTKYSIFVEYPFNPCGNISPNIKLRISHKDSGEQNYFEFSRINSRYKLTDVGIRTAPYLKLE